MPQAIEKEMSGHIEKALVALLAASPIAYRAQALREAFEGIGTDKDRLCRVLGGTNKSAMGAVNASYLDIFGMASFDCFCMTYS